MTDGEISTHNRAMKNYASTLGILVGLAGVNHGFFEFLQGNVAPDDILIDAIGPSHRYWQYGTETALTIIPNLLVSGLLAIVLGLLVTIWASAFIDRKSGAPVFLLLSISLFLVGGGFAPIFLTVLAFVAATRINTPLRFWRTKVPARVRTPMARLWPWTLVASVLSFVIAVEIAIFGNPLLTLLGPESTYSVQFFLGLAMLVLALAALLAAHAHDAQRPADPIDEQAIRAHEVREF